MPIYEYRCQRCDHELEVLQKISDDDLEQCPQCDQPALKKLMSAAGFRLKGSGWYETDFKSGNQRNLHDGGENKDSGEKKGKDAKSPDTGAKDKGISTAGKDSKKSDTAKSSKSNTNKPASAA